MHRLQADLSHRRLSRASSPWSRRLQRPIHILMGALMVLALTTAVPAQAQRVGWSAETGGLRELRHSAFRQEEGAPNSTQALAQTADGFLWIGTLAGLYRFDGAHFDMEVSKRLLSPAVRALLAEPNGRLWIGYTFGGVSVLAAGQLQHFQGAAAPAGGVKQFFRTRDAVLWVSTSAGLWRLSANTWTGVGPAAGYSGESPDWLGWVNGQFGVLTRTGTFLYHPDSARFERQPKSQGESARYGIPPGSAWRPDLHDTSEHEPNQTWLDERGSLWLSGLQTLVRYQWNPGATDRPREDRFTTEMGLTGDVTTLLEDREGNLWAGTDRGLDRFSIPTLSRLLLPDGVFNPLLIPGEGGNLWLARTRHPLISVGGNNQSPPELGRSVTAAFTGADGTVLTAGQDGLFQYSPGHGVKRIPSPVSVADFPETADEASSYQAIAVDAGGTLWLSIARAGLFCWDGHTWSKPPAGLGLPPGPAIRLTVDAQQRLWITYPGNQLAVVHADQARIYTHADGLNVGNVLVVDVHPAHTWIGGDRGIAVLAGNRFTAIEGHGGVDFHLTSGISETQRGDVWLNCADAVYRIAAGSLKRVLEGTTQEVEFEAFDWVDGLEGVVNPVRPGPSLSQTADGRLWIARFDGVWSIDPQHIHRNLVPPLVSIEGLVADRVHYDPRSPIHLPMGAHSIRIDYTAASLTYPEHTRFRYQLSGVDTGWEEAGPRRQAYYTNIGPGPHQFRVIAANKDGIWSVQSAPLQFTLAPAFYQTLLFKVAATLAAVLILAALFMIRLEQIQRQYRRGIDARHSERERIARDVHDTLLQGAQAILFRLQMWQQDSSVSESLRREIAGVVAQTKAMVINGRERILMMRRTDAQPADLTEALAALGNEASVGQTAAFAVEVEGDTANLTVDAKNQLIDIAREAILNAYQHAAASRIRVRLKYRKRFLEMKIEDDGRGIDAETLRTSAARSHFGLMGMRERARQLGGRFHLQSSPGGGSRITVTIPAKMAYRDAFRWPWQRPTPRAIL
jgi:signal transduction histidine kinase/ligand-binding sensor domain-containing protein